MLNFVVVPHALASSALGKLLKHPCVQRLMSFPAGLANFQLEPLLRAHHSSLQPPRLAAQIVLNANSAGLAAYWALHASDLIRSSLSTACMPEQTVMPIEPITTPLPRPMRLTGHAMALISPGVHGFPCPDVVASMLAAILPAPPPLQLHAHDIVYTNGSKKDNSITAAWVHMASGRSQVLCLPGPSSHRSTALRGELMAIHVALAASPGTSALHLMTDSLTSLYIIAAHLVRPTQHRHHKHRWLIEAIVHALLCRSAPVHLSKVRAHAGIVGNEAADALASQAHDDVDVQEASYCDPLDRGPAWVQHDHHGEMSDLNDLRAHALSVAQLQYKQAAADGPDDKQSKSFASVHAAVTSSGGLHAASSTAFGGAASVRDWARTRALQLRQNTLTTASKIAKWYPSRGLSPACVLCGAPQDTIAHRLGACVAPAIKN